MMYKSSHVNHLDRGELEHELDVRGFRDFSGMKMEEMRKKLRGYLKKERSGTSEMPSAVGDQQEVDVCREKVKQISEMTSLLALPSGGTDVQKLKRKLEALIYHTYQRIERIANTHDVDKQQLSQEIRSNIRRYEELTQQSLQHNSDVEKSDSSNQSQDKFEKETNSSSYIRLKETFQPSDLLSSSEENAKSLRPRKKSKIVNRNKKTNIKIQEFSKKERKKTAQLSTSETESSSEEVVEKIHKRKKGKKNKKKTRRHRKKSSSSSSSTSSSEEESFENRRKATLRRTPVRFWNLRFSGDDNTSVGAFLADVEDRRVANHMSFRELFNVAGELFTGSALAVYRSCRGNINDWQGLETKLRYAFQDPDYDRRLIREIENRKQGPEETATVYIAKMRSLFSRLTKLKSEEDMIDVIEENVLPEYQSALCLQNFRNIEELEIILRRLEKGRLRAQRYDARPNRSLLEPDLAYKPRIRRDNVKVSTVDSSNFSDKKNHRSERSKTSATCWNCRKSGHVYADCSKPKTIFCYGCGKENTIKSKCPSCKSKTTDGHSENSQAERQTSGYRSASGKPKTD